MNTSTKLLAAPAAGIAALLLSATPALASTQSANSAWADLQPVPLNGAPGSGAATLEVNGTTLSFSLTYDGLLADAPHAAHIHFSDDAMHTCPTAAADTDDSGFINVTEGAPSYGAIVVSLTTLGDTSPASGLAVDRFGVGDDVNYSRGSVEVDAATAAAILDGEVVIVVHGVDYNDSGTYDAGDRGMSDLDPALPGEATDPALCGVGVAAQMTNIPAGGVDTGEAGVGTQNLALAGVGGLALISGALVLARRRTATDN